MWSITSYKEFGITLYAVEDTNGFIYRYCDTYDRAKMLCEDLNSKGVKTKSIVNGNYF